MAQEFRVIVRGGDMQAMAALAGASLKVAGVPTDAEGKQLYDEIWVVLSASDPGQAHQRVMQHLPANGNYRIERIDYSQLSSGRSGAGSSQRVPLRSVP